MTTAEFLGQLLADAGYVMMATPLNVGWRNVPVATLEEALAVGEQWSYERLDVYFALATFREKRVWNASKMNRRTNTPGAYERRTKANALALRSLFLDLDVKPGNEKAYNSQEEAVIDLRAFVRAASLPPPMVVNSGYGVHVYWPLEVQVTPEEWEPTAQKLKAACIGHGLKIDAMVTADSARVLRLPGTFNYKRDVEMPVEIVRSAKPVELHEIHSRLQEFITEGGYSEQKKRRVVPIIAAPVGASDLDNLGVTSDPGNLDMIAFGCPALAEQIVTRGASASEPQWRAALGLARFCVPQLESMAAVSDGHADYDEAAMQAKVANWTGGPSTCNSFWSQDNETCENCQWWKRITSPIQLGRTIIEAEPPTITVEDEETGEVVEEKVATLPYPYTRKKGQDGRVSIVAKSEDAEGNVIYEPICPYDLYPIRILRQTGGDDTVDEHTMWRMVLPKLGNVDINLPQSLLGDTQKLHRELLAKGLYINPNEAKLTQHYMTAYIRSLSEEAERDKVYERLGWHDDHKTFVLPRNVYFRDGSAAPHAASRNIKAITKGAIHEEGVFDMWLDALDFYKGAGNEAFRFFIYCSFAAPLFHLTGHKGVLIAASGDTGHGKSTVLEACASVWGAPEPLLVSGGSDGTTTNALYQILGTYHSLPMLWDETTEREADEMRRFLLNISQGKGKERMKGHEHDGRVTTWETMVLSSANTDDVSRLLSTGKDSDPHLMRLVSVEFDRVDRSPAAKERADAFKAKLREHYGHAGPRYIRYITENYDAIKHLIAHNTRQVDRRVAAQSHERFWTAAIACAITGAQLATRIGALRYDYKADIAWMEQHITRMRTTTTEARTTPAEVISEFLAANVASTLALSTLANNMSNVALKPTRSLLIRHEVDSGIIYVSRSAIIEYCTEHKANFRKLEQELLRSGALASRNVRKILGADSMYAKGQMRCWKLIESKLDASVSNNIRTAVAAQGTVSRAPVK